MVPYGTGTRTPTYRTHGAARCVGVQQRQQRQVRGRAAPMISCEETSLSCAAPTAHRNANSALSSTSVSDASDATHLRFLPRFGMRSATHRQRWGTRGPTLSWVIRCAPAACGEGVTLRSPCQRCSTPTHSCSTRARRCSARVVHTRARATLGSVRAGAEHARSRARVRYNCENTSHLQFLSDTEIPIYAQNLLHNTK